jgi:hypothetical protein
MTTRTTRKTVTFTRPFSLAGSDGLQPAGAYNVDTEEELIDDISFLAYRRLATVIHMQKGGLVQIYSIDPVELEARLLSDVGATVFATAN